MSPRTAGSNPFDRLRSHFDDVDMTCRECGYEDEDGEWRSMTDGREVRYQHMCPSCGKVSVRSITVGKE